MFYYILNRLFLKASLKGSQHFTISRYSSLNPPTRIIFLKFKLITLFPTSYSSFTSHNQKGTKRKPFVCYHDYASLFFAYVYSPSLYHRYVLFYFLPHNGNDPLAMLNYLYFIVSHGLECTTLLAVSLTLY